MFRRLLASLLCLTFSFSNLQHVQAQEFSINQLPVPGTMIGVSAPFAPLTLKGLVINPQKPLEFKFLVDTGKGPQDSASIKEEANRLVKYFLAGLTIPEGELWVNLSPYEKNRITTASLGQTELGRDLLVQDYILKQLTASLIYPEKGLGKEFWSRVYAKAQAEFGTTNIPVNTFNKVWILPDEAQVYENGPAAYVTKSTLKVMLDEDYLARQKHQVSVNNDVGSVGANIVREIVIPEITKEVNTGKNFAPLRQIYNTMILAKWYKESFENGLLDAVYTNKNKTTGVNLSDPNVKERIYQRYLQAYKKGVFNYIKEGQTSDGQTEPRKYFSGGFTALGMKLDHSGNQAMVSKTIKGALLVLTVFLSALMPYSNSNAQEAVNIPSLIRKLENSSNENVRRGVIIALSQTKDSSVVPALMRAFRGPTLVTMGKGQTVTNYHDEYNSTVARAIVDNIISYYQDDPKMRKILSALIQNSNGTIAKSAISQLGVRLKAFQILDIKPEIFQMLFTAGDLTSVNHIIFSSDALNRKDAESYANQLPDSTDGQYVKLAYSILFEDLSGPKFSALVDSIKSWPDEKIVVYIRNLSEFLNEIGDLNALNAEKLLLTALNSMIKIGTQANESTGANDTVAALITSLGSSNEKVSGKAAIALSKIKDERVVPALRGAFKQARAVSPGKGGMTVYTNPAPFNSIVALAIVDNIIAFYQDDILSRLILKKLVQNDNQAISNAAKSALRDEITKYRSSDLVINPKILQMNQVPKEEWSYSAVQENISTVSNKKELRQMRRELGSWQSVLDTLSTRGSSGVSLLIQLLIDPPIWNSSLNEDVRGKAAVLLGQINDPGVFPALMGAFQAPTSSPMGKGQVQPYVNYHNKCNSAVGCAIVDYIIKYDPSKNAIIAQLIAHPPFDNQAISDAANRELTQTKNDQAMLGLQKITTLVFAAVAAFNSHAQTLPQRPGNLGKGSGSPVWQPRPGENGYQPKKPLHSLGKGSGSDVYQPRPGEIGNQPTPTGHWVSQGKGSISVWSTESKKDKAMINGGIDLNQITIKRTGHVIKMQFDPAQLGALEQGGFEGFEPVIINMTQISSPFQLLGINL